MGEFTLVDALGYRPQRFEIVPPPAGAAACGAVKIVRPARAKPRTKSGFPVLVVLGDDLAFASAVDVAQTLISTNEVEGMLILGLEALPAPDVLTESILPWAGGAYGADSARVIVATAPSFGGGVPQFANAPIKLAPPLTTPEGEIFEASLARCLQAAWPTGRVYGQETAILKKPMVRALAKTMRPLMAKLAARAKGVDVPAGAMFQARQLGKPFEVFVSLPEGYNDNPARQYPALVVLDGNILFAPAAHIARSLARAGEGEPAIIIGLGVPRQLGEAEFALRRLEEFSPPADGYDFKDELAHILAPLYALRGKRVKDEFGTAPLLHHFIAEELLPALQSDLRIDTGKLALFGHSAGGTYTAFEMRQADTPFTGFLCSSPGLALSGNWLWDAPVPTVAAPREVLFGIGALEYDNAFNIAAGIPGTPDYAEHWRHSGDTVSFTEFADETHASVMPRILASGLRLLWGK